MGALIFILVCHYKTLFSASRFVRYFSAAAIGVLFEVAIFMITGTTAYGIVVH